MDKGRVAQLSCNGALRMALMSDPATVAISGDVDEVTYPALLRALGEFARGRHEVHIDLSAVEYCDLAGLRAVIRLALAGRTVVLHALPAHLQTVLGILGWDGTPGLVIDNKPPEFRLPLADRDPALLSEPRQTSNAGTRQHRDAR